jgi:hypothetical protein
MLNKDKFEELRIKNSQNCVSIYIPTEVVGDYEKNRILWKNACQEARNILEKKGLENTSFLNPAFELVEDMEFWAHQTAGLAGFYTPDGFATTIHLYQTKDHLVMTGDDFHLAPLLKELTNENRIFILALSQKETRFFEAVESGIYPVFIHDVVVKDMKEALNIDEIGKSLQHHATGNTKQGIHHGNSAGLQKEEVRLEQYIRRVDDGIMEIIHDEKVPLVLAAVEEYHPIYSKITKYNFFSDHLIAGNPERLTPKELRGQVDPFFEEMRKNKLTQFEQRYRTKLREKLTCNDLPTLEEAVRYKNVDAVLVTQDYINQLADEDRTRFNTIALALYDQQCPLLITDPEETDLKGIHALHHFEMHLEEIS